MFPDLSPRTKAATFTALVMSFCIALCVLMRSTGEAAAVVAMFTPVSAVLIMMLVVTRDGWTRSGWSALGLGRAGFRLWPIALLGPIAVLAASEAVVALTGLTRADVSIYPSPGDFLLNLVVSFVVVSAFSAGEEIGWRGYLLPLVQQDGRPFAAARVGFLHGLWHLPIVFIVAGAYLTEGNRWLTVPVFLAVLTTAGVVYGWLRDRSGSVWPAVIVHSSFNIMLGVCADTMVTTDLPSVSLVGRETGVATLGALILFALFLTTRRSSAVPAPADSPVPVRV